MAKQPFSVSAYLDAHAKAALKMESMADTRRHAAPDKKKATRTEKKPKGYSTFETLRLYREGKGISEIAAERGLAESTIEGHIVQLVELERIKPEEIVSLEIIETVNRKVRELPEAGSTELLEAVNAFLPSPISYRTLRICRLALR